MTVNWEEIRSRLPTARTPEEKEKRVELFGKFDVNGDGNLSLAEIDKGVRDVLHLEELYVAKPVVMRAFTAAKTVNQKNDGNADYVEFSEFRLLLVWLKHYLEIWEMFQSITKDDRRIDLEEFKKAASKLETWGHDPIDNPEVEFQGIDKNGGGLILFEEFADWVLEKHLHLEKDFPDDDL